MSGRLSWRSLLPGLAAGAVAGFLARDLDLVTVVSYWGDRTTLVVPAALLGTLLWPTRGRRLLIVLTLALAIAWLLAAFTPLTRLMVTGLVRRDPVRAADAVFVLSSDVQPDGEFTATAESRLLHGLELIGEGRTGRLVLSELPPPKRPYAEAARALVGRLGLTPEVLTVGPVRTTRDEAVAVGRLYRERGWHGLLLVTSPLHSRRASLAFEHEGIAVVSSPAAETRYDLEGLDRADHRLQAFGAALHERVGLWAYRRRGWF